MCLRDPHVIESSRWMSLGWRLAGTLTIHSAFRRTPKWVTSTRKSHSVRAVSYLLMWDQQTEPGWDCQQRASKAPCTRLRSEITWRLAQLFSRLRARTSTTSRICQSSTAESRTPNFQIRRWVKPTSNHRTTQMICRSTKKKTKTNSLVINNNSRILAKLAKRVKFVIVRMRMLLSYHVGMWQPVLNARRGAMSALSADRHTMTWWNSIDNDF